MQEVLQNYTKSIRKVSQNAYERLTLSWRIEFKLIRMLDNAILKSNKEQGSHV